MVVSSLLIGESVTGTTAIDAETPQGTVSGSNDFTLVITARQHSLLCRALY